MTRLVAAALIASGLPIAAAGLATVPTEGAMPASPAIVHEPARRAFAPPEAFTDPAQVPPSLARVPIALLMDLSSGQVLYAKDENRRFVPASITKVMTLYLAFELLHKQHLKPDQHMQMSEEAFKKWHNVGSTMFLDRTMNPTVDDLLLGIANVSANDACVVLAEGAGGSVANWTAMMNAQARRLGMKDSHFSTPNGWMDEGQTYVTAHDLATLASAMIAAHPDKYHRYIGHETMTWNGITQANHDPILGRLPGADGIKTGFTNQAGYGYLGSAIRDGRRLIMVVAGVDLARDRATAARDLMEWGFAAFASKPLFAAGAKVGEARVQGGQQRMVSLVTPSGFGATIAGNSDKNGHVPISLRVVYDGPLEAPIEKGSIVAALEVRVGNAPPSRVPLLAGESVGRADWLARLRNGLLGLFSWSRA
ncbi:MAG: D-alanyl-D-alanine carboxypeptidase family protein [Novosphingobium sp.]